MGAEPLTRRQVASRLGKSVATVRRLEGVILHPRIDSKSRRWFDAEQVERLARDVESGQIQLWRELLRTADPDDAAGALGRNLDAATVETLEELEDEVETLRTRLASERGAHNRELASLREQLDAERSERRELERQAERLLAELESILP